jgi:hypothetical protein
MGFSHLHSSDVPLVLNLETGSMTPQYHVVFYDHFSTVSSVVRETDPPDHWAELCLDNTTHIPNESSEITDTDSHVGPNQAFDLEWISPEDHDWAQRALTRQEVIREALQPSTTSTPTAAIPPTTSTAPVSTTLPAVLSSKTSYAQIVASTSSPEHVPTSLPSPAISVPSSVTPLKPSVMSLKPTTPSDDQPPQPLIPCAAAVISDDSGLRRSTRSTKGVFQKD